MYDLMLAAARQVVLFKNIELFRDMESPTLFEVP